jgi:hypothetical protein
VIGGAKIVLLVKRGCGSRRWGRLGNGFAPQEAEPLEAFIEGRARCLGYRIASGEAIHEWCAAPREAKHGRGLNAVSFLEEISFEAVRLE